MKINLLSLLLNQKSKDEYPLSSLNGLNILGERRPLPSDGSADHGLVRTSDDFSLKVYFPRPRTILNFLFLRMKFKLEKFLTFQNVGGRLHIFLCLKNQQTFAELWFYPKSNNFLIFILTFLNFSLGRFL